jgi:hypothetical protein
MEFAEVLSPNHSRVNLGKIPLSRYKYVPIGPTTVGPAREVAGMLTSKTVRTAEARPQTALAQHTPSSRVPNPNPVRLNLSGSVFVDYDVAIVDESGSEQHLEIRVQFPDEVRSLLETMSWRGGARMTEKLSDIGTSYVLRVFGEGNLASPRQPAPKTYPRVLTVHPSLDFVRASLVTLPAPV